MADDIKTISAVTTINVQGASNRNTNDNSNGKSLVGRKKCVEVPEILGLLLCSLYRLIR